MKTRRNKLYGPEHAQALKCIIALNRATNAHNRRTAELLRAHGLTLMEFAVLEVLDHKGSLSISEIIEKILSTSGNMTVVINNLERDGMITRTPNPRDKRAWLISISPQGAEKIREVFPQYLSETRMMFAGVTDEEKKMATRFLKRIGTQPASRPLEQALK